MSAWKWNKNQYKSELDDNKPIEWLEDHHFAVNESRTSQRDMEVKVAAALSSTEISALLDSQDTHRLGRHVHSFLVTLGILVRHKGLANWHNLIIFHWCWRRNWPSNIKNQS